MQRLDRTDWSFLGVCAAIAAVSIFVVVRWFSAAFPEASIDFKVDRAASENVAAQLLSSQHVDYRGLKHTATFDSDDTARIFLERSLGLNKANDVMRRDVRVWRWSHRWFRPLQEEEWDVDVAPTGEIIDYRDQIPENRALPSGDVAAARAVAEAFLRRVNVDAASMRFVSQSERNLPRRVQRIFTWESATVRPAGAPYRFVVNVDGDRVSRYQQRLKVPDDWQRSYRQLRSKNLLAGQVDSIFLIISAIAAVVIFIVRLLRGDLPLRMLLGIGAVALVLVTGVAFNSFPQALAGYDTTESYGAFLLRFVFNAVALQGVGAAMLLIVIVGAGEVLYRQRMPNQLALPRLWNVRALASKRVFRSFALGYTLVAFFLGYQVAFYLIAEKFGAWSPAEVPYDEMLSSALPWVAVLFAGFFPALSEEFLSRAFSIPFFERVLRSRVAAIVLAGFIWGFGHATYPNQPFFIRGLEVGLAGVVLGFLFFRFGILPLIIWHYTVDALYTALLLLRSGNRYYIVSGALAALVCAIPMIASIVLYLRNGGFVPDDDLSNATLPVKPVPSRPPRETQVVELPAPAIITPRRLVLSAIVIAIAIGCVIADIPSVDDAVDYRSTAADAKRAAQTMIPAGDWTVLAQPVDGFRSWDKDSSREDGGSPSGFDAAAADYLLRHGMPMRALVELLRAKIYGATWMVRAYKPLQKEEYFVEVHARDARVVGYHRYQDEKRAGAQLDQAQALAIARSAFPRFGVREPFELKEALTFQQPARRDWLFHFDDPKKVAGDAVRRVSVRVAGNEVTQFATTVKVPESVYREASEQTIVNVLTIILKIIAILGILALIIAGFVTALRHHHFPWRTGLRWTVALAVIPIATALARWPEQLFNYSTSIAWKTFVSGAALDLLRTAGVQLGIIFLAVVALEATIPGVLTLHRREVRKRLGRGAALAALTAIALIVIRRVGLQLIALRWPAMENFDPLHVPDAVALPLPSLLTAGQTVTRTLIVAAAAALFIGALQTLRGKSWLPSVAGTALVFFASLDSSAKPEQLPLALLAAASAALLAWLIARHVLGANLLAWPLAAALAMLLGEAATLLQNHRPDLQVHGWIEIAVAAVIVIWVAA
jgi:membrane protease YdiL (CAAX protease family)